MKKQLTLPLLFILLNPTGVDAQIPKNGWILQEINQSEAKIQAEFEKLNLEGLSAGNSIDELEKILSNCVCNYSKTEKFSYVIKPANTIAEQSEIKLLNIIVNAENIQELEIHYKDGEVSGQKSL